MRIFLLPALGVLPLLAQGPANSISISAPSARLMAGTSMKLQATARDAQGRARSGDTFTWSNTNPQVAAVAADGTLVAGTLGHTDVTAAIGNLRSTIRIQVLPSRIVVTPASPELYTGQVQQFAAAVLNANGESMPDVALEWSVLNGGGGNQNSAVINASGLFRANLTGRFTIRATFRYSAGIGFVTEYSGTASVQVYDPQDYKLSRLLTSDTVRENVRLRLRQGWLSVNNQGQLIFPATLEGLDSAVVRLQDGRADVVALAGLPGAESGNRIWDLYDPSVNANGVMLVRASMQFSGNCLLMVTPDGANWAFTSGSGAPGISAITNVNTSPWSLTDSSDNAYLFRADFRWAGETTTLTGLFRSSSVGPAPMITSADELPGLQAPWNFNSQYYGMDAAGNIVFRASDNARTIWYRVDTSTGRPSALLATGDNLAGYRISGFSGGSSPMAISQAGEIAIAGSFENGPNFVARWKAGASEPEVLRFTGGFSFIAATRGDAGTLVAADLGKGQIGLNLWKSNGETETLLSRMRPGPTGEPIQEIWSAAMNPRGEIFATLAGVDTPWMLVRLNSGGAGQVLLTQGAELSTASPSNLTRAVIGDHEGAYHHTFGGDQWSLFELGPDGLLPRIVVGDRLPSGALFLGDYQPRKSSNGDLYITNNTGLFRVNAEGIKLHFAFPFDFTDRIRGFANTPISVTDSGQFLLNTGTNDNHNRLALVTNGQANAIAYYGNNARWQTPLPGGGLFDAWNDLTMNDDGQVLGVLRPRGGPAGLYLFDGGGWNAVCLIGSCVMFDIQVASIDTLRGAGKYLFARFNGTRNERVLARWSGGTWTPVLRSGDSLVNGAILANFNFYDVNRLGDALVQTNDGGQALTVVTASRPRVVHQFNFPTRDGAFLRSVVNAELRDDGRVYFTALDYFDRVIAYAAAPQF
jgi:hypothetical protein